MIPDLEQLILLQQTDSELRQAEGDREAVPGRKAALEQNLGAERERLEAARQGLDESQRARRQKEGELQSLETRQSRYKQQLMDVKTNKEYTAMLHEIETVEREIRTCEDTILGEMERAEVLTQDVQREEGTFKEAQGRFDADVRALEKEAERLDGQLAQLREERETVAAALPFEWLDLFNRVAGRRGTGVCEAVDRVCTQCHMKLRLQMFVEIKRRDSIQQCPSCSRVLYYVPSPPTVVPEP